MIYELKYSNTNTYLIKGEGGYLLFDTGWAGTLQAFCRSMGELNIPVSDISYILVSHFHPDHMGIAQEIAELGPTIMVADVQKGYIHLSDHIFEKEKKNNFRPIEDDRVRIVPVEESRDFLKEAGIDGEIIHTPGHSDDSISLILDERCVFVGDLNPLYELELHRGTLIEESWNKILAFKPKTVYYGHAKTAIIDPDETEKRKAPDDETDPESGSETDDRYYLVSLIMRYIDKKMPLDKIQRKTGADRTFIDDVARMYLTHQNVGVQGVLDRIEIKNK